MNTKGKLLFIFVQLSLFLSISSYACPSIPYMVEHEIIKTDENRFLMRTHITYNHELISRSFKSSIDSISLSLIYFPGARVGTYIQNYNSVELDPEYYTTSTDWIEIDLADTNFIEGKIQVYIDPNTDAENSTTHQFWAIRSGDDIRFVSLGEFSNYKSELKNMLPSQTLSESMMNLEPGDTPGESSLPTF